MNIFHCFFLNIFYLLDILLILYFLNLFSHLFFSCYADDYFAFWGFLFEVRYQFR